MPSSKCRSKNPTQCPYHGPELRMTQALRDNDFEAYGKAKKDSLTARRSENSVDSVVRANILQYPLIFQSRGDVLHHALCVIGNGFEWKNGAVVSRTSRRFDHPKVWVPETAERHEQFKDIRENSPELFAKLETEWKAEDDKIQAVVDTVDDRMKDMTLRSSLMAGASFYPQSHYALLMNIPDNVRPEWSEACEEMKVLARQNGWNI